MTNDEGMTECRITKRSSPRIDAKRGSKIIEPFLSCFSWEKREESIAERRIRYQPLVFLTPCLPDSLPLNLCKSGQTRMEREQRTTVYTDGLKKIHLIRAIRGR